MKKSMRLKTAVTLAARISELLSPHCIRIDVAGSIRRCKPTVSDIEILCIPKKELISLDMFTQALMPCPGFDEAVRQMTEKVIKGSTNGRYMQILLKGGATLDLFMPAQEDYFRLLAIRTGPAFYSHTVIAAKWKSMGWVGCSGLGLRRREDCEQRPGGGSSKWVMVKDSGQRPPVWQSEEDFFNWLGLEYLHPTYRESKAQIEYLAK